MPEPIQKETAKESGNQTSNLVAAAGGFGTFSAAFLGATQGYTLSSMAASNTSFPNIIKAIKENPSVLSASTFNVAGKLALASTRLLVMPSANKMTQSLPPMQQDLATTAAMSTAELPSAVAELFEVKKASLKMHAQLLATAGKETADKARLLVNTRSPSTWAKFFTCTMIKNAPLNYVSAHNTRLANEASKKSSQENKDSQDKSAMKRVLTSTGEMVVSSTVAGTLLQGPLYRSARNYSLKELAQSIPNPRNIAVGLGKGLAHVPIGFFTFGAMEVARSYEKNQEAEKENTTKFRR